MEGHPADAPVLVKRPGFERVTVQPTLGPIEVVFFFL